MGKLAGKILRATAILFVMACASAKRFSIMAPNVFHVGVPEKVSVSVFDAVGPVTVQLYLQDYPYKRTTFSHVQGVARQGSNLFLEVKVEPKDLQQYNRHADKKYVYLVAKSNNGRFRFHKEGRILLSYRDGIIFIQTDKPIYTPRQSVKFRVIPLEFDLKPSQRKITVTVMNPQGIRVEEWNELVSSTGIISRSFDLGNFVLFGNWTIAALSGYQNGHNSSVQFEVKEYVLPKFAVKLSVPPYILDTDDHIMINITTRYTYGKSVIGTAVVYLSVMAENEREYHFAKHNIFLDKSGVTTVPERIQIIKEHPAQIWFPLKGRLVVKVDVIEQATGNKESVIDKSCHFTTSPYIIKFKNTQNYFKPGLRFVVKVIVTQPNKKPAINVPMLIEAHGMQGNTKVKLTRTEQRDPNVMDSTDINGEAIFLLDACKACRHIAITVKTVNRELISSQNTEANFVAWPFNSGNGRLVWVRQLNAGKVGRKVFCESYRSHNDFLARLSFAVVSRGQILYHNTTDPYDGTFKSWSFHVTPEMSPSARLIGYYIDNDERVLADSILLEVENTLPTKVNFPAAIKVKADGTQIQVDEVEKFPGENTILKIKAPQGTRLGLLSVDQSVYLLRNANRLTKERIFKSTEELDQGCGVGGGKDNRDVFMNAGVILMTNNFVSDYREGYDCANKGFRKRRSVEDNADLNICCEMGKKKRNESCAKLTIDSNKSLDKKCRLAFWKCCTKLYGTKDTAMLARSRMDVGDFAQSDEQMLDQTQVRSFFPETWIFDEKVVGPDGQIDIAVTMPDTITSWIMQAIAINNKTGLGLATPLSIVVMKELFVSLNLPYSVKRGEQVSLLATVFNYRNEEIRAKLYLKGDKQFCSIATPGNLAQIGLVKIPPNDARSVAVPIIPKTVGEITMEVSSIFQVKGGGLYLNADADAVRRRLLVVPEGVEHRKSQSFILDPDGVLNGQPKDGEERTNNPRAETFESRRVMNPDMRQQLDIITLKITKKAIPDHVKAAIFITGNILGAAVDTTIEGNLEKFFRLPTGCGEQTMVKLAPNVYVLKYLMQTKRLSGADEGKAFRFIQSGYQHQLTYRKYEGSFSTYKHSLGSTWLTAFVIRVFCQAQRLGIYIDKNLVCKSVTWLNRNQRSDGALPEVKEVFNRGMTGGVYTQGVVAMTAFVLSSLAECKCGVVNSANTIRRARQFLEREYRKLGYRDRYTMALTAYALTLVNSREKIRANERLMQHASYDYAKRRYWYTGSNSLDIETAGYALLTQVMLGRISYAGPIVSYLTSRRIGFGFSSTQDTVVALQALALYSEKTAVDPLNLRVKVTAEMDSSWSPPEIYINQENALLRREINVKELIGGYLWVESRGTGVAMLEVEVRYYLPSSRDEVCKFDLNTTVSEIKDENAASLFGPVQNEEDKNKPQSDEGTDSKKKKAGKRKGKRKGKGCKGKNKKRCKNKENSKNKGKKKPPKHQPVKSIHLNVCTRYKGHLKTGMAIIDIGILTGFKPDMNSLKKLEDTLPEFQKLEISDRSLVIYLKEISNSSGLCMDIQFDREYYVGVVQAVPVFVYDYYEPDDSCSVFYGPDKFSPLKLGVCDIGSGSCKCSQVDCAQEDPPIGNVPKLINIGCEKYHYVVKGKVLLIDEENTMLTYVVEVLQVIQQGNKDLKVQQHIELIKRAACTSPNLEEKKEYLFMGLDKDDKYKLDRNSFVKLWPDKRDSNKDILEEFAQNYAC